MFNGQPSEKKITIPQNPEVLNKPKSNKPPIFAGITIEQDPQFREKLNGLFK